MKIEMQSKVKRRFLVAAFWLLSATSVSFYSAAMEAPKKAKVTYEYAVFYMETEGEFVIPVGADAPVIYSWSDPKGSIKGDIQEVWNYLKFNMVTAYSFTEIESAILNHVASIGWEFQDLEITSVPVPRSEVSFRTAYRYVFKREKQIP